MFSAHLLSFCSVSWVCFSAFGMILRQDDGIAVLRDDPCLGFVSVGADGISVVEVGIVRDGGSVSSAVLILISLIVISAFITDKTSLKI
jgi:hypothetical protein